MSDNEPVETLKRVWGHNFPHNCDLDGLFVIDESLPGNLVAAFQGHEDFSGLTVTQAQANAALEYWRTRIIEGVEEVATRLRAEIATHNSEPTEGK
jgi:hypothetical protein